MTYKYFIRKNPILIHVFKFTDKITYQDHDRFINNLKDLFGNRFYVIFDLRDVIDIDMGLIYKQVQFMKDYEELARKYIIKSCIIITNYWCNKMLNLLFYLKPPVSPNIIVTNIDDCIDFIKLKS
jgi:hypothetical protein